MLNLPVYEGSGVCQHHTRLARKQLNAAEHGLGFSKPEQIADQPKQLGGCIRSTTLITPALAASRLVMLLLLCCGAAQRLYTFLLSALIEKIFKQRSAIIC